MRNFGFAGLIAASILSTKKAVKQYFSGDEAMPTPMNMRPVGPGWTNRQVQRMARKKRNVKANRKSHQ